MLNIPKHNCQNCGSCCGPVPITVQEQKTIQAYVDKNKPSINKQYDFLDCKFRVNHACSIYSVRPIVCRLFGVTKGLACPYGNTHEIDGAPFISKEKSVGLLNDLIK